MFPPKRALAILLPPAAAAAAAALAAAAVRADDPTAKPPAAPIVERLDILQYRDPQGVVREARSPEEWDARRRAVREALQQVMGPLPGDDKRVPLDVRVLETRDENPDYLLQKIDYASEPGDRVPAWLLLPKGPPARRPAFLVLHQTVATGKDEVAGLDNPRPNRDLGRELARRGYVVLAPDYPGFNERAGLDVYAMGYASASMKAIWDNIRAVDLLSDRPEVDPERLGVAGHSLGGHNAIFTAQFEPRLKVVASSCGFTAFPRYYGGNLAGWSHKGYMPRIREVYALDPARMPFDFPELVASLAPRRFYANAPLRDDNFDVEGVRQCVRAAARVYALHGVPERLLVEYPDDAHDFPPAQRLNAFRFFDEALKPPPPAP